MYIGYQAFKLTFLGGGGGGGIPSILVEKVEH